MNDFNPRDHIVQLKGKAYLQVNARVYWFRQENPQGRISTEVLHTEPVLVKATIYDGEGRILATDHAGAKAQPGAVWSGREIEKACTAATGRALALCGYGI